MPFGKQPNNVLNVHLILKNSGKITKIGAISLKCSDIQTRLDLSGRLGYTIAVTAGIITKVSATIVHWWWL